MLYHVLSYYIMSTYIIALPSRGKSYLDNEGWHAELSPSHPRVAENRNHRGAVLGGSTWLAA